MTSQIFDEMRWKCWRTIIIGLYETGSRLDLDIMTVWNLQSGFLWAAVKVRRQVIDPQRVQLLPVKPHQQSGNEGIEKRKWKSLTSMVLPKWGEGLAQEVQQWCKSDASVSQPFSTWTDTSLAPRESVSKCSRPTHSWRSGWRQTSTRRSQAARPRSTCPASNAWVVLSGLMLIVESFGVVGHPLRLNCPRWTSLNLLNLSPQPLLLDKGGCRWAAPWAWRHQECLLPIYLVLCLSLWPKLPWWAGQHLFYSTSPTLPTACTTRW